MSNYLLGTSYILTEVLVLAMIWRVNIATAAQRIDQGGNSICNNDVFYRKYIPTKYQHSYNEPNIRSIPVIEKHLNNLKDYVYQNVQKSINCDALWNISGIDEPSTITLPLISLSDEIKNHFSYNGRVAIEPYYADKNIEGQDTRNNISWGIWHYVKTFGIVNV